MTVTKTINLQKKPILNLFWNYIEKIRKFIIAEEPFSTENGLLTPTMKVRRHKVFEIYGEKLDDLYGSKTH